MDKTMIGLDLEREFSQISFYNERSQEVETVAADKEQARYLIPTPTDLFSLIEGNVELGQMTLANFFKTCIGCIRPEVQVAKACIMVTMKTMEEPWPQAIRAACQMTGFAAEDVFLQTHRESFCYYTLNQKRDLWLHSVALFEYEDTRISSYLLDVGYGTRPALVHVRQGQALEMGAQGSRSLEQWNARRDELFLELIKETFQQDTFSSIYLIGDSFDKTWAVESLQFLCRRRHVFQGRNLYTKGACYAAMQRLGVGKKLEQYLYHSEDMVQTNLSMQMQIRGKASNYLLIGAGVNWFEASHTCEFIADGTREIVLYGRSMLGGETESYSIVLKDLPERKDRTVRLQLTVRFLSPTRCKVTIRDLGFGEFYPPSGMVWESVLEVA